MAKTYQVTQKVTINGKLNSSTFPFYGEEADLTAFCSQLEGGYEVKEVVAGLSNLTGVDTNVATKNTFI
jgi:hypothetical protein